MEHQTITNILSTLRNTSEYKNLSDDYIKKSISQKYNLQSVKKTGVVTSLV